MVLHEINDELQNAASKIDESAIEKLIDKIDAHKRIFVYGTGRSGLMLKAFAMRLMQIGYETYVIGETITPSISPEDLLITASASGETESVVAAARSAAKQGAEVAVICGQGTNSLAKISEPLITIESGTKFSESQASRQPLGSLFEQMVLLIGDGTIMKIVNRSQNMNEKMARRHASVE